MQSISIQRDATVTATDGEIGRVKHVIVDTDTREVTDLVVGRGADEWVIPMKAVAGIDGDTIMLSGSRSQFRSAPAFHRDEFEAVDQQRVEDESAGVATHGGAPLRAADEDTVIVGDEEPDLTAGPRYQRTPPLTPGFAPGIMPAAGVAPSLPGDSVFAEENPWEASADSGVVPLDGAEPYHLELREERLRVEKEEVQAGLVRITKQVREWEEAVTVPLREERLVIEVLPGSGLVTIDGREMQAGDVLEVPLLEERATIVKETVVSENVTVRKETALVEEQYQETLRREELAVEEDGELDVMEQDLAEYESQTAARDR